MFLTLIKTLIALQSGLGPIDRYPSDYGPHLKNGDEFDFIIVGAGSAGCVLANRLTENSQWRVLVLEAGGYPSALSEIPAMAFSTHDSEEDWQYKTEPSATCCLSLKNNVCKCPRGKSIGGSSVINLMLYTRSTRYDHDRWVDAGNIGWDYDSIAKYYKKFENVHFEGNKYYGTEGDLHLTKYKSPQPIRQILERGYQELGYHEYTEDTPIGYRDLLLTVSQGTRQNAGKAFLSPVKDRSNLFVATNSRVSKILVDTDKLTAYGVEVKIQNRILNLKAKKEVIISAGTINSPHILMNSGIGPKDHLNKIGIEVIQDLQVGNNYQDHVGFPLLCFGIDQSVIESPTVFQFVNELYQFFINRQGAFSNIEITNFGSYINTKNRSHFSNVQFVHAIVHRQDPYLLPEVLRAIGAPEDVSKVLMDYNQHSPILFFLPILLSPKSSGHVRLQNSDPFSTPLLDNNFLSDENDEDIGALLSAIQQTKELVKTKAFEPYHPKLIDLNTTKCRDFVPDSDDYWKCTLRHIAISIYHPVGTCKMGPESDPSAVVDPQLKVRGVNRLRVIDASVMPIVPSCNTNAPTLMIAEKGADLIKQDWANKHDEL